MIKLKKLGKKRKAKDSKKSSMIKKKRKNNSSDISDNEAVEVLVPVEEYFTPKAKSKKTSKKETPAAATSNNNTLSVSKVCESFGLNNVDLEYTDADYQSLTTYKLFLQTYQSRIQQANPKAPQTRLWMLLAAK